MKSTFVGVVLLGSICAIGLAESAAEAAEPAKTKAEPAVEGAGSKPASQPKAKGSAMTLAQLAEGLPDWWMEQLPEWVEPYVGRKGLPAPWNETDVILAPGVGPLDRWQANRFIVYRPETAKFLYEEYTPLQVKYRKGSSPLVEKVAEEYARGCKTDTDKAVSILTKAFPDKLRHPTAPPTGPNVKPNRNLSDDELLASGCAWCNEQARVFCAMCHALGIPARIIHLFYTDGKTGHTIAEFYADGRWAMADASYDLVFPGADGKLMSAAQCHDMANHGFVTTAYHKRIMEICQLPDDKFLGGAKEAAEVRAAAGRLADYLSTLGSFAVINHPCPK
ncbi:MAG: hypothetical protein NTW86_08180 [Candidatus Sumerlaeota bacterium]|nr:hypothetical protein [Candidatus Sumerlaeota bacterium]